VTTRCPKCRAENSETQRYCGECGTRLGLPETPQISVTRTLETPQETIGRGTLFAGRYEIIEELGAGGMGEVYRVEDKKVGQEVALKLIKPEIAANKKTIERFRHELKTARMISHRNVCRMFDLGEEKGTHFITMEYVAGEDLKSFLRRAAPLSTGRAIAIGMQVCEGLAEAHRLGVVHRDLKPGNIMIDKDGNARIMDFGIARSLWAKGVTGEGVIIGTPEYMSPEQAESREVDARSDIYSLGIILYEMVTGRVPFEGETSLAIVLKHRTETPRSPKALNAQIPDELNRLILRCLEKNKERRYQSAAEVLADLSSLAKGLPTTSGEIAGRKTFGIKLKGKKRVYVYTGAAVLLIAAISSLWLFIPKAGGDVLDSIAVLPLENISGDPEQENFADVLTIQVTADLYKISALRVIPPESVRGYKKSKKPLKEIAKELNVKAILSGSVLRSGNRAKLIARLIDPAKDEQIWAQTFEKEMGDIYFLQSELSQAIVGGVKVAVSPQEKALLASAHKVLPEAYDLYLKAHQAVWISGDWNLKTVMKGIDYLEQAVKIDPSYAQAYAELGINYHDLAANGFMPAEEAYPKAEAAALKAMELEETLAGAHFALGWIKASRDWNFSGAEQELKKAIELGPGNDDVQWSYNVFLNATGRSDEAIARQKPLEESMTKGYLNALGFFYLCAGRYKEGLEEAKKAAEKNPSAWNNQFLVLAYGSNGMHSEALSLMNEIMTSADAKEDSRNVSMLAWILALSGRREEALATMEKLKTLMSQMKTDPSVEMAKIYAALGNKDKAFELLNSAYEKRVPRTFMITYFPEFHSLRDDPRFKDLLKKIGLE